MTAAWWLLAAGGWAFAAVVVAVVFGCHAHRIDRLEQDARRHDLHGSRLLAIERTLDRRRDDVFSLN